MTHGDFTRIRRSQNKNYRKVLFQQGRVLTDADFNDHVNIDDSRESTYLKDIIGNNGIPIKENKSFEITLAGGNKFKIGKGTIYIDGLQVENYNDVGNYAFLDGDEKVIGQPYVPSLITDGEPTSDAIPTNPGMYLVYIKAFDKLITYLEDPDIQDSALGDSDTSTRIQTTWQALLHKLDDAEIPEEENKKWTSWIPLGKENTEISVFRSGIKIGFDNKGELLEVFALSDNGSRIGIRQISFDPTQWESNWNDAHDDIGSGSIEFDIVTIPKDDIEILHTFEIDREKNQFNYYLRGDESRWGKKLPGPPGEGNGGFVIKQIKLILDASNKLFAFAVSANGSGIFYSRQLESLEWDAWRAVAGLSSTSINMFSLILNPNNDCLEVYTLKNGKLIEFTRQKEPNSNDWIEWTKIDETNFFISEMVIAVNQNNQLIVFVSESTDRKIFSKIIEHDTVTSNWNKIGANNPGNIIFNHGIPFGQGTFTVLRNPRSNRLEVFGIFSDTESSSFGRVWNLTEDAEGNWDSNWEIINSDQELEAFQVRHAIDGKSNIHIFTIAETEDGRFVHHTKLEHELMSCNKFKIQSYESKIIPSTWQIKARTKPGPPPPDGCLLPEEGGYKRLENQLYRIEIHDPKSAGKNATFKFSRDNGTICSKITDISDGKIGVTSIGRDALQRFEPGGWVEINNGELELRGKPGVLVYISEIKGNDLFYNRIIPPDAKLDNDNFPRWLNPTARRWDSSSGTLEVEIPDSNDGWIEIEGGIQVKFKNIGNDTEIIRTGDNCTFAARTSKADIEWPKGEDGLPEFVHPDGIEYHYAKLAILEYKEGNLKLISDCREFFHPLKSETKPVPIISWVHGTISQVGADRAVTRRVNGTGTTYNYEPAEGSITKSIHFPVTISYLLEAGKKMYLEKIFILFKSNNLAKIVQIDIFRGRFGRNPFPPLDLHGDHGNSLDESNTLTVNEEIEIDKSLGISINVEFKSENSDNKGEISFYGVGAQFKIN